MSQQDMDRPGCLAGCDRTPRELDAQPTPGQLLHGLHTMIREDQLDKAQRMLDASDAAVRCFTRDHEGRLARDDHERAVLLWLHAEAVWRVSQFQYALRIEREIADSTTIEIDRLRREVEFEARGANTFAGADAIADGDGVTFVAEDFGLDVDTDAGGVYVSLNHRRTARTVAWGDDVNVDYDANGVPTGVEILRRPSRAVHPEADR